MKQIGALSLALGVGIPAAAAAQMPATPVLQNAWANAGITVAVDYGKAQDASAVAGAVAWAPARSRFQLSAGAGVVRSDSGGSRGGYGARLSVPVKSFASGSVGAAIFGGVGVTSVDVSTTVGTQTTTNRVTFSSFPVGAAFGFRHALGATRGISAYLAPFYVIARQSGAADSVMKAKGGAFRASAGLDVTLARQIGLTVGYEMGAKAKNGSPGPRGGVFGVGLSYALRRQ